VVLNSGKAKPEDEFIAGSPMGGGYSTVDDLAGFADALLANQLLSRETTARVRRRLDVYC